jgi:hypothetical protein
MRGQNDWLVVGVCRFLMTAFAAFADHSSDGFRDSNLAIGDAEISEYKCKNSSALDIERFQVISSQ